MSSLRIVNARIVNEGEVREGDLRVVGERIDAIGPALAGRDDEEVIDADGAVLMPGMIDDQVHFREPGLTHKGDLGTESKAAVAGGITSYMEMPNCKPLTVDAAALEDKHRRAAETSWANWGFYFGATNDNLDEIVRVDTSKACGLKVFMGASTGNMLVDDPQTLDGIFSASPLLIATHCEDTPTITANEAAARETYGADAPAELHVRIRSREACIKSSTFAVELARRHDARLHVLHLATAEELDRCARGPVESKRITAEACVHHLYFDERDYATKGADIKCNPSIKTERDREAIWQAVSDDRIDVIATDHAPHTREEKARPFLDAPAGLPLVQHALLSLFEHVAAGRLDLPRLVLKACHAPARLFGVRERGFLREGYYADLALVDDDALLVVDDEPVFSKCGWTPFAGHRFGSRVAATVVNGRVVWRDGRHGERAGARALVYDRG
jgi:dihydroorotase